MPTRDTANIIPHIAPRHPHSNPRGETKGREMTPSVTVAPAFTDLHDLSFARFVIRRSRGACWSPVLPRARLPAPSRQNGRLTLPVKNVKMKSSSMGIPARPYKCTIPGCTSLFGKANHLSRHVRIVHNKERPFKCDRGNCVSRFGSRSHLVDHVNAVHKRLRNFRCERCNAAFSKSFNLAKHKRLMHNTSITKSHRCTYDPDTCDLAFGTRSHLTRHISKVHKQQKTAPKNYTGDRRDDDISSRK